jgi:hypothetical protein
MRMSETLAKETQTTLASSTGPTRHRRKATWMPWVLMTLPSSRGDTLGVQCSSGEQTVSAMNLGIPSVSGSPAELEVVD